MVPIDITLTVFSFALVLACHFVGLHPYISAVVAIGYANKRLSKMAGNSASYIFNSWSIDRL